MAGPDHANTFDDTVVGQRALDGEQGVELVLAEAGGERGLVAGHGQGGGEVGRAVVGDEMERETLDHGGMVVVGDLGDLDEGGAFEIGGAEEAADEGLALLAGKGLGVGEGEGAAYRPFAGRGGALEDTGIGLRPIGSRVGTA